MNCFQNVKYGVNCREAAERYGVVVDLHAVPLRRLPAAYAIFDVLKTIHALSSVK